MAEQHGASPLADGLRDGASSEHTRAPHGVVLSAPDGAPDGAPHGSRHRHPNVSACLLAGGEGRRMGGQDKGLVNWAGQPLALSVLRGVAPQVGPLMVSANRHLAAYAGFLRQVSASGEGQIDGPIRNTVVGSFVSSFVDHDPSKIDSPLPPPLTPVFSDDPDLPPRSGPLAGILSALRRLEGDWLQIVLCDSPRLPPDLVARLLAAATQAGADIAIPQTETGEAGPDAPRPHWVCALLNRRTLPTLEAQFAAGERKVSRWVCTQAWTSVFFADSAAFTNINTLETPHAWG